MKRSPLKRKTQLRRGKRVKPMSDKRRAENIVRTTLIMNLLLERGNECEAVVDGVCSHYATDAHETLSRGRGGSITNSENIILICRPCHDWIHAHPASAKDIGLLKSAHGNASV